MNTLKIVGLSAFICLVFWFILMVITVKLNKKKKQKLLDKTKAELEKQTPIETENVVQRKIDKLLKKDVTYIIGSKGGIVPGKYIIVTADESNPSFDIKLGNYYKLYDTGNTIILKNGEEVTPVTCDILLR